MSIELYWSKLSTYKKTRKNICSTSKDNLINFCNQTNSNPEIINEIIECFQLFDFDIFKYGLQGIDHFFNKYRYSSDKPKLFVNITPIQFVQEFSELYIWFEQYYYDAMDTIDEFIEKKYNNREYLVIGILKMLYELLIKEGMKSINDLEYVKNRAINLLDMLPNYYNGYFGSFWPKHQETYGQRIFYGHFHKELNEYIVSWDISTCVTINYDLQNIELLEIDNEEYINNENINKLHIEKFQYIRDFILDLRDKLKNIFDSGISILSEHNISNHIARYLINYENIDEYYSFEDRKRKMKQYIDRMNEFIEKYGFLDLKAFSHHYIPTHIRYGNDYIRCYSERFLNNNFYYHC